MALKLIEGFDMYSSASDIAEGRKFRTESAGPGDIEIVTGRLGGKGLRVLGTNSVRFVLTFDQVASGTKAIFGLAVRPRGLGESSAFIASASGTRQLGIGWNQTGYVSLFNENEEVLVASSSVFLQENKWYFFEVEYTPSASGAVNVYVNGELALAFVGDTMPNGGAGINELILGETNVNSALRGQDADFDDIYVIDETAVTGEPDARIGDCRVELLEPGSDVTMDMDIVGATGGWETVDDTSIDFDVTYVESDTVGDRALFGVTGTLSDNPLTIHGVSVTFVSRKEGASTRRLDGVVKSGTTEVVTEGRNLLDAYASDDVLIGPNPDTGSAFTRSEVEALEFGVEVGA